MKYKRLTDSIDSDYQHYLGVEGIYDLMFGHKRTKKDRMKGNYIWKSLLKQYPERVNLEQQYLKEQANLIIYPD